MQITNNYSFCGELTVPGDKSISHRSIMFGAISQGLTEVTGFLQGLTGCPQSPVFKNLAYPLKTWVIVYISMEKVCMD